MNKMSKLSWDPPSRQESPVWATAYTYLVRHLPSPIPDLQGFVKFWAMRHLSLKNEKLGKFLVCYIYRGGVGGVGGGNRHTSLYVVIVFLVLQSSHRCSKDFKATPLFTSLQYHKLHYSGSSGSSSKDSSNSLLGVRWSWAPSIEFLSSHTGTQACSILCPSFLQKQLPHLFSAPILN